MDTLAWEAALSEIFTPHVSKGFILKKTKLLFQEQICSFQTLFLEGGDIPESKQELTKVCLL